MEVAVPCCVGGLVAIFLMGVLPVRNAVAPASRRAASGGALAAVLGAARAVGRPLASALPAPGDYGIVAQVRAFSWKGVRPLREVDDATATGIVMLLCAAGGVVGLIVSLSFVGFAIGCAAPLVALAFAATRRRHDEERRVEEAMPEAFGALAISLGSGYSLAQAMRYVGGHADEPVRSAFMRVAFAVDCGESAVEALDAMLERFRAPGLDLVVLALKVSQRTGAPLKDLLAEATKMVTERIELRRRLDVKTSQARMSAHMVASMPIAMTVLLSLLSSDYRAGMATTVGMVSLLMGLALNAAALMVIRRIMTIEL